MPKRTISNSHEENIIYYKNKIKRLEKKIRNRESGVRESVSDPEEAAVLQDDDMGADTPALRPEDWLPNWPPGEETIASLNRSCQPQPGSSTTVEPSPEEPTAQNTNAPDLDKEIMEILGDDPCHTNKYGPEIRKELADRLLHIVKNGLSKEDRKNLISKYPLPQNCMQLDAPKINLEIKAATTGAAAKRDKGIELKQKQMSSALACLADIINSQINSDNRNHLLLRKLMDLSRILCDLQHADSITRRNFLLFPLKNDMKEHLKNTKIDSYLFSENLADAIKLAKAVNKSGSELKADASNKPVVNTNFKGATPRTLSRRAPLQARRPPVGPAPPAPRSREPTGPRARYPPPHSHHGPTHGHSLKTSSRDHQHTYPRRHY